MLCKLLVEVVISFLLCRERFPVCLITLLCFGTSITV